MPWRTRYASYVVAYGVPVSKLPTAASWPTDINVNQEMWTAFTLADINDVNLPAWDSPRFETAFIGPRHQHLADEDRPCAGTQQPYWNPVIFSVTDE
jgi:hypothetical protein